ncbi:pathogenesis-related protein 1A-like [Apium graveolens]|uniref:pathogenesis-related protein 1A-like n=1 Tax=Apium graveolens TaxID=4045 RepID=UPI003D7B7AC0
MYFQYLLTFLTLALLHHSHAQNSNQDFLDAHNAARAQVGVAPMTWDPKLAAYAYNHTNSILADCKPAHSIKCPYGENLAKGARSILTGTAAVKAWVAEQKYYNYSTNTCLPAAVCGHYTQVVWKKSVRLGCARALCNNGKAFITTCSYDPPGNYKGMKPY